MRSVVFMVAALMLMPISLAGWEPVPACMNPPHAISPTEGLFYSENYIQPAHVTEAEAVAKVLRRAGYDCFIAQGASMQPSSFAGYTHCTIPYNASTDTPRLTEGMIVTYEKADHSQVHHRIVGVYNTDLIMQGDHNVYQERINKTQVRTVTVVTAYT